MSPIEGERYRDGVAAEATPVPDALPDTTAEAALVSRFRERLRVFALRRLRDPATAEDVAQETLRRVLEAWRTGRVENPDALPAFVFQTAQYVCLHHFRSRKREGQALFRLGREPAEGVAHPLVILIDEERRAAVRESLDRLPPADRDLLSEVYYDNVESRRLAERLGITQGALRVRKHRALARLADLLKARESETNRKDRGL